MFGWLGGSPSASVAIETFFDPIVGPPSASFRLHSFDEILLAEGTEVGSTSVNTRGSETPLVLLWFLFSLMLAPWSEDLAASTPLALPK